jgi:LacI family transcriptional regulator
MQSPPRRILLALGWYDHEINIGVAQYARQAGWVINDVMGHTNEIPTHWVGDGMITLLQSADSPLAAFVCRREVPVVDLVCEAPDLPLARCLADNHEIGRLCAEHLLGCGIKDLAFFNLAGSHVERERQAGFETAVRQSGGRYHDIDFMSQSRKLSVEHDLIPWLAAELKALPKPLGVMGQHDREALYVVHACEIAGLEVPDDVAIIGVDADEVCGELGPVPLSSVDRRRRQHGFEAAALLDRLIDGEPQPPEPVRVKPGQVIARQSTSTLAVSEPSLRRALQFIAQHFQSNISVSDVVDASFASRRRLYTLFEQHLGHPIRDEIIRRRIDHARGLLTGTDEKLFAVAMACGFSDAQQLSKVFRKQVGMPPSEFRRRHRETDPLERPPKASG